VNGAKTVGKHAGKLLATNRTCLPTVFEPFTHTNLSLATRVCHARHRGNTFFDVTATGQWSSPSGDRAVLSSNLWFFEFYESIGILRGFNVGNIRK